MLTTEPYYRKKGDKFIIEQKLDGKTKYLKTLPDAKTLLEMLEGGRPPTNESKASSNNKEITENESEKFAQDKLPELLKKDALEQEPTEEEIKRSLWEITKE